MRINSKLKQEKWGKIFLDQVKKLPTVGIVEMEFDFLFVFKKCYFVSKETIEFQPQLSYGINERQHEDAVHSGAASLSAH
jgi:hypothetical protein